MIKDKKKNVVLLLALLVMFLWGSLFPFIKLGYKEFSIDTKYIPSLLLFAGIRFTICGFLILVFSSIKERTFPKFETKKEWIGTLLVGLIAVMLHYSCTYIGLSMVDSSKTALLKQSGVLIFICFAFLFIKEDKFTMGKLLGVIFGLLSIIFLNFNSVLISFGIGETIIIIASLCTVSSNVVCKKMLKNTNAVDITGYSELIGGIILLVIGLSFGGSLNAFSLKGFFLFLYIIIATVVSYVLWYSLVQKSDLSNLFIIKLSEPLFTAITSVIILSEDILKWQYLVSFVCVGLALVASNVSLKRKGQNK